MTKFENQNKQYKKALESLVSGYEKAINTPKDADIYRDSTIQRFEFCFDLSWKIAKEWLFENGVECRSPRECLVEAYTNKLLNEEEVWLDMLRSRNTMSHLYDESQAKELFLKIPSYIKAFNELSNKLSK